MSDNRPVRSNLLGWIKLAIGLVLLVAVAAVGYRWASGRVKTQIYRDRLEDLASDYESLRSTYNQAVARTAVTELIVADGKLSVEIRTIEGVRRTIPTPFDPSREIYCDYVLMDGRLWIRRVYDSHTPPREGLVIGDNVEHVDWNSPAARYGKAVYRSLSEGRWIVTVTGDGSLGLAKVTDSTQVTLSPPPPVRDYEQIQNEVAESMAKITFADVFKQLVWGE